MSMINAFGLDRTLATKYEYLIGEQMRKVVDTERHAMRQKQATYAGRSTAERHRAADEVSEKVLAYIASAGEPVTRAEILSAISDESDGSVRYAVEKLTRERKINAQRFSIHSRLIKFSPKEEDDQ